MSTRVQAVLAFIAVAIALVLSVGCKRDETAGKSGQEKWNTRAPEVIVYCSADAPVAQPILDAFSRQTGIKVLPVFDTEATKTTGLVNRLLAEHESGRPQADVWWSSEPFGTIRLAHGGVLSPYTSGEEKEFASVGGWPAPWRGQGGTWYAFAFRTRQIVFNSKYLPAADAPQALGDLLNAKLKGRVGMARPQFGTTRGHMAAVYGPGFEAFLSGLKANDLRLYDGNASVVRAVGSGEVWAGLTDNDDVEAGKANGWPVDARLCIDVLTMTDRAAAGLAGPACVMPNTVALVNGGKNTEAAGRLVDFLLSEKGQRLLADSEAHATALHPVLSPELWRSEHPPWSGPTLERIADQVEPAMAACERVLEK